MADIFQYQLILKNVHKRITQFAILPINAQYIPFLKHKADKNSGNSFQDLQSAQRGIFPKDMFGLQRQIFDHFHQIEVQRTSQNDCNKEKTSKIYILLCFPQ